MDSRHEHSAASFEPVSSVLSRARIDSRKGRATEDKRKSAMERVTILVKLERLFFAMRAGHGGGAFKVSAQSAHH